MQLGEDVQFLLQVASEVLGGQVGLLDLDAELLVDHVFEEHLQEGRDGLLLVFRFEVERSD